MDSINDLEYIGGDLGRVLNLLEVSGMAEVGKSHNRFIVFGESLNLGFRAGKYIKTELSNINTKFVKEYKDDGSHFKSVLYKDRLFEVGSLARGMVSKEPIINALHKRYRDSTATRVFARVYEIALMLDYSKSLLTKLELSEPSCTVAPNIKIENFKGVGVVEASRGSLIHKLDVRDFKIENYEIIVPTQWNLSRGDSKERGVAVEAMVGTKSIEEAEFIFRTFDVCSVCTQK
jgi:hydrogenase large subunit